MSHSFMPEIVCGPILRKISTSEINLWLITSRAPTGTLSIWRDRPAEHCEPIIESPIQNSCAYQIGEHAWVVLITVQHLFESDIPYYYDLKLSSGTLSELAPHVCYNQQPLPSFIVTERADHILHGSCRHPHHPCDDALATTDRLLAQQPLSARPDMLIMSGDQIYADDVAGPMLAAIHQLIQRLGLIDESFEQAVFPDTQALYQHANTLYGRKTLLPKSPDTTSHWARWFNQPPSDIFTSNTQDNHLISFAEFIAMYCLVWSPNAWQLVDLDAVAPSLDNSQHLRWQTELAQIKRFAQDTHHVARLMAHVPVYMIFDDHDITDDWNLTIGWEQRVYQHPLSNQIIHNGLLAYWFCQGWGNAPEHFDEAFHQLVATWLNEQTRSAQLALHHHLQRFENWHYVVTTEPKVVVLDTRTRRWRSESRMNKPSGLMDWEALIEFQQEILHQDKVVIVSAAPMFGVKFIETLQRAVTWLGHPLKVDAENWMAHPGSANTLISIFTHTKTPTNFVILSGDVHYSFAYDIQLRSRKSSPNIFQITCSGFRNQFPEPLLTVCDVMDRLLYSPHSPLNWLTKRKRLEIHKRTPSNQNVKRLVNQSAVGEVKLDPTGRPVAINLITARGKQVHFPPPLSLEADRQ